MKYRKLLVTGPEVSSLCLGTVFFGTTVPKEDAFRQMDCFFEKGGNFFDTARVYADWLPAGHGASERTLGDWIKERNRDKVIISTKGAHPDLKTMDITRMSKEDLRSDLEESLCALGTDYIDIYFLHRDDVSRPVEDILGELEEFRKEGKIRCYGCSNWALRRVREAEQAAVRHSFSGFACNQIRFGLADLTKEAVGDKTLVLMDRDFFAWHEESKKPVMAYTSSCNGYFSKKIKGTAIQPSHEQIYGNAPNYKLLEKMRRWEEEYKVSAAVLASAYVMAQSFPSVAISAFSSLEQLDELIVAADFDFPSEVLLEIRKIKQFLV
jgi:aryl-alcohol dehydrogenase-like predicted oxidoreductase